MLKRILLPTIFIVLAYGFWISPEFKEIAAGVAIFLFGMVSLEEGFKVFTGGILERILQRSTDRLWKSLSFGIVSTSLMQSSSLVSVITISFLSAGLIGLMAGVGIIFGANIGTTTGAWLVAGFGLKVKISAYAMPMLVFGVILLFQKSKSLRGIGYILAGLGFLFLGIHYMKVGFESFKDAFDLARFAIPGLMGLLVYTGVGVAATVVMQSSHATLILTITALAAGQITYENSLALAIGANIGTTITAILGALSANVAGKRLAGAHLIFNVSTGLIAIIFMNQLVWAVDEISVLVGIAADNYTLKLAVFHTLFNLIGVSVNVPFMKTMVNFLEKVLPDRAPDVSKPHFLNEAALAYPDTALKVITKETRHLFNNAFEILAHALSLHRTDILSDQELTEVTAHTRTPMDIDVNEMYQRRVKGVYSAIIEFAARAQAGMSPAQANNLNEIVNISRDLVEAVKNVGILQSNVSTYLVSDNLHMRTEYDRIRARLGNLLRQINRIDTDPDAVALSLDETKVDIHRDDILTNGTLDRLIRKDLVTAPMASSLINDSAIANSIGMKLINAAEMTLRQMSVEDQIAEHAVSLGEDEIEDVLRQQSGGG